MSNRDREGATLLLAIVAAALCLAVANQAKHSIHALTDVAGQPLVVTLVAASVIFALLLMAARLIVTRRALGRRVRLIMLPADSFDPDEEGIVRFAAALSRSRRVVRGILDTPASAVRVRLDHDAAGRLRYALELPRHARDAVRTGAGAYGAGVELHAAEPIEPAQPPEPKSGRHAARAELVLARPSTEPLRPAGLSPDPLAGIVRALSALDVDRGETAAVCIDLLPVTPAHRRRMRRRLLRQARHHHAARRDGLAEVLGDRRRGAAAAPAELVERRAGAHALTSKLGSPEPLFVIQVLARVACPDLGRAKRHMHALLAAFDAFAGENHFRVVGVRVPGIAFLGSDLPGRRGRFDRRFATGLFAPARRRIVTATEIAGLLKPPTVKCQAPNVLRSGGIVPPPPPGLPTFTGQPDLLPLGRVATERGERVVGVPLADTFFAYCAGRSRFGKTEMAMGQFIHLARSGHGCFFLDPHQDAIHKIKSYLTTDDLRRRIVEVNLAATDRQPGWNLFATAGRSTDRIAEQVDAVVAAFASALGWTETNTRALNLTTQAAQALTDVARRLPAELAPTIFQIPTLLSDDEWRAAILPFVSPATRQFFTDRFPRLPAEAITPVTNLIDRLRVAPTVAALLGSPTSSYDVRAAMDQGQIVLVCPGSGGARDRLIANLFVFDLLHAAKTRVDLPPDRRRPFYVCLDEVQTYDGPSGDLASLLEQAAKYGARAFLFNQNPERLTAATLNAVTTNRSHLLTTAVNAKAASLLTREWGGTPEPEVITRLNRFAFLASVTLAGEVSPPFRLQNLSVNDLFPDSAQDESSPAPDAATDQTRRPVPETLTALDGHDARILEHLHQARRRDPHRTGRTDPQGGPTRKTDRSGEHRIRIEDAD